jgi:hypothetical protein
MIACSEQPIALRVASSASVIGGGPTASSARSVRSKDLRFEKLLGIKDAQTPMKLPAAAYSAEIVTSATKAGIYEVFGEGE